MNSQSAAMLWELIGRMANTCLTFRISGEIGVGKEAIARLIYRHYPAKKSAFIKIKCEASSGLESHAGASGNSPSNNASFRAELDTPENRVFYFENIHCLPIETQMPLQHMLTRQYTAGAPWVFASSIEPIESMQNNPLTATLSEALDIIHIAVPPLRAHTDKIPQILAWYVNLFSKAHTQTSPAMPSAQNMDRLQRYHWPGNLRQLQTVAWAAFESSDWDAALACLDTLPRHGKGRAVDEIAAIYLMSLSILSIRREKIMECLMMASKTEDMGLLDLAIYNEAITQIADHIDPGQADKRQDDPNG